MGKVLRVDLTAKTLKEESIPESVARKYLGGKAEGVSQPTLTLWAPKTF